MESQNLPKTLQQAIKYFSDEMVCIKTVADMRWPDGEPWCPNCGLKASYWLANQRRWKCRSCKKQYSVKVGTIFEDSPIGLDKWFCAMWMIAGDKNGVSSYEIHRALGISQKSAWFMMHRIRKAMQDGSIVKLGGPEGEVEVDETFIGGKSRNMHKDVRARRITGTGGKDKAMAFGMLERGGKVVTMVLPNRQRDTVQPIIKKHVKAGTSVFTDEMTGYSGLNQHYAHQVIDHAVRYVDGKIHTNGLENFWSLFKRCVNGTYVSVEPFHLFRYLDEESFRYNNRATKDNPVNDGMRFEMVLRNVAGKRLTYKELTGKEGQAASN